MNQIEKQYALCYAQITKFKNLFNLLLLQSVNQTMWQQCYQSFLCQEHIKHVLQFNLASKLYQINPLINIQPPMVLNQALIP